MPSISSPVLDLPAELRRQIYMELAPPRQGCTQIRVNHAPTELRFYCGLPSTLLVNEALKHQFVAMHCAENAFCFTDGMFQPGILAAFEREFGDSLRGIRRAICQHSYAISMKPQVGVHALARSCIFHITLRLEPNHNGFVRAWQVRARCNHTVDSDAVTPGICSCTLGALAVAHNRVYQGQRGAVMAVVRDYANRLAAYRHGFDEVVCGQCGKTKGVKRVVKSVAPEGEITYPHAVSWKQIWV